MAQQLDDDYCTIAEAARSLRVSVSTVWRWIASGRLTAYRVGQRRIRIRKEDLASVVQPFREPIGARTSEMTHETEILKMCPTEGEDQLAVIRNARALQERILARRGGVLLPPSWQEINEDREERTAQA
ncbi:MAG: DNA-binding protein [Chloroflexota bacterium]|nr:MAG: DNA-binding protein [Chloroflexota bacterium]